MQSDSRVTRSKNPARPIVVVDNLVPRVAAGMKAAAKKVAALQKVSEESTAVDNVAQVAEYETQLKVGQQEAKLTAADPPVSTARKVGRPRKLNSAPKSPKAPKETAAAKKRRGKAENEAKIVELEITEVPMDVDPTELPLVSVYSLIKQNTHCFTQVPSDN